MGYLSTGIIGALTAGISLLKGSRQQQWTWRIALAWVSWAITVALAIGAMIDVNREHRGADVAHDSPRAKALAKQHRRSERALRKSGY